MKTLLEILSTDTSVFNSINYLDAIEMQTIFRGKIKTMQEQLAQLSKHIKEFG